MKEREIKKGIRFAVTTGLVMVGLGCVNFRPIVRVEDCQKSRIETLGPGWIEVLNPDGTKYEVREPSLDFDITTRTGVHCGRIATH